MTLSRNKKRAPALKECVANVCRIVRDRGHNTFATACRRSGYDKLRPQVTQGLIEAELRESPDLIDYWLGWASDKRSTPAWHFGDRPDGRWVVGYYHNDPMERREFSYDDRFVACARFIKEEMEESANNPALLKKIL